MKGKTRNALYRTWANMIARCQYKGASGYENYGGRGIKVCERWLNSFDAFVEDMGQRPPKHTIERNDNNGNYEPGNCRWATMKEQQRNKRASRFTEIKGEKFHVAALAESSGVDMRTIVYRIEQGWPIEKVLSKKRHYNNVESQKKAVAAHAAMKRAQTHCKNGHELTPENVYEYKGHRACRACRRAWDKFLYYGKKRPLAEFL